MSRATADGIQVKCVKPFSYHFTFVFPSKRQILDLASVQAAVPIKQLGELPVSYEDGGGLHSEPD